MPTRLRVTAVHAVGIALVAILSSAFAATPAAVDLSTSMTNDEAGFTIAYPPAWIVTTYPGINQIEFSDGPAFLMLDAVEIDGLPTRDPAELLALITVEIDTFIVDAQVTDIPVSSLDGLDPVGVSYTGAYEGLDLWGTFIVMVDERHAYVIHFEAPAADRDAYAATFTAMLESFTRSQVD